MKKLRAVSSQRIITTAERNEGISLSEVINPKRVQSLIKRLPEQLRVDVGFKGHFSAASMPGGPGTLGMYDASKNTVHLRSNSAIYRSSAGYTTFPSHPALGQKYKLKDVYEKRNGVLGSAKAYYHEYAHVLDQPVEGKFRFSGSEGWEKIAQSEWKVGTGSPGAITGKGETYLSPQEAFGEAFSQYASTIGSRAILRKTRPESFRIIDHLFESAGGVKVTQAIKQHREAGLAIGSPEAIARFRKLKAAGKPKRVLDPDLAANEAALKLEGLKGKKFKSLKEMGEEITRPVPPAAAPVPKQTEKLAESLSAQDATMESIYQELNKTKVGKTLIKKLKGNRQLTESEERALSNVARKLKNRAGDAVKKAEAVTKKAEEKPLVLSNQQKANERLAKERADAAAKKMEVAAKEVEEKKAAVATAEKAANEAEEKRKSLEKVVKEVEDNNDKMAKKAAAAESRARRAAANLKKKRAQTKAAETEQKSVELAQEKRNFALWKVAALAGGSVILAEALRRWSQKREEERRRAAVS